MRSLCPLLLFAVAALGQDRVNPALAANRLNQSARHFACGLFIQYYFAAPRLTQVFMFQSASLL